MIKRASIAAPLWFCLAGALTGQAAASTDCSAITESASRQALDRLVVAGDDGAAACLSGSLRSLDGGELEDALVALGRYGENKPEKLLLLAHRGILAKASLASAVSKLPSSLSDDLEAQAATLEARRSLFASVVQSNLLVERQLVLRSLASAISDIRSATSAVRF